MSATYRILEDRDFDQFMEVAGTAFAVDTDARAKMPDFYRRYQRDWTVGAEADGRVVATVTTIPLEMFMEGSVLPLGGVTVVSCLPEYRRQGHVGKLLIMALELMKERGQSVGGLYTPHAPLYRRYGWEICSDRVRHEFQPKQFTLRSAERPRGRLVKAGMERWRDFDSVYRRQVERRNGELVRTKELWWLAFQGSYEFKPGQTYLWESPEGQVDGFLSIYEQDSHVRGTDVTVRQLIGLTPDATSGLLQTVLSFDLARNIIWETSLEEPVLDMLSEPLHVNRSLWWQHYLRIVDIPAAFALRPCYGQGAVVVEVEDRDCHWNSGRWRLSSDSCRFAAERTNDEPELVCDAPALAQLFAGYRKPSALAAVGRLSLSTPDVERLDDLFRTRFLPYTHDFY
ncbi:MAG: GNAT family N-acetyltransferase [Dehalococcoidia bacterium]